MKTTYKVFGDKKQGFRIAIPTKAKTTDKMKCIIVGPIGYSMKLPPGSLVYVPKVGP